MICLDEGILREHLDGELPREQALAAERHVARCAECRGRAEEMRARSLKTGALFAALSPIPGEIRVDSLAAARAYARFKARRAVFGESGETAVIKPLAVHLNGSTHAPAVSSRLSLTLPEEQSFIARLVVGARQFVSDFGSRAPRRSSADGFCFLLPEEPFVARLRREVRANWQSFRRDPRGFVAELLAGEASSPRRRRLMQAGTATAMIAYACVFTTFLLAGAFKFSAQPAEPEVEIIRLNTLTTPTPAETTPQTGPADAPKGKGGLLGGSKAEPKKASGGGGGGNNLSSPPSAGRDPLMSPLPQVNPPNPEPPKISNPKLIYPETTLGDAALWKPVPGPVGLKDGVEAPPSSGPGTGGGMGTGKGTGAGPGNGAGQGPGLGYNKGDGVPDGGGGCCGDSTGVEVARGNLRPTIIYREKAKYTEEARQLNVQGTVTLSAIFGADGQIYSIRIVRGLPGGLTEKAIEAARNIRFRPAVKNGVPVSTRMTLEYNFALY
jgi:TonB family protein